MAGIAVKEGRASPIYALEAGYYTDPGMFAAEVERIFSGPGNMPVTSRPSPNPVTFSPSNFWASACFV